MIIACIVVYNEERMLPGCLESLRGQVERIVVVDGAFATFPLRNDRPYSTDATQEIVWCYGAEWIPCPRDEDGRARAWHTEMEKRTAYFVGQEGDWYFHIDADERLVGRLPDPKPRQHYALLINVAGRLVWVPRLWQHRGDMRYEGSHNAVWSAERLIHLAGSTPVDPEVCRLVHLSDLRPAWQQVAKRRHYARRTPTERAYRRIHGI